MAHISHKDPKHFQNKKTSLPPTDLWYVKQSLIIIKCEILGNEGVVDITLKHC